MRKFLAYLAGLAALGFIAYQPGDAAQPPAPCNIFTSALNGCVPASGGGTTKFLRADGTFQVPPGSVTSVGVAAPSSGFTVTGSPITGSGTITLTPSGTSGGIPYYSSATAVGSSAALTNHQLVLGGGAGAAPTTLGSLGTTTTLLHGNAAGAPSFTAVNLATDVTGNLAVGNLNGGTGATSSTFWRGDGTWATTPGTSYSAGSGLTLTSTTFSINDAYANVWTAQQSNSPVTLTISGSTFAPNGNGNNYAITLVHASCPCAIANPTATPVPGTSGLLIIQQSATGSDLVSSWGSYYSFTNGSPPVLSTAANAINVVPYYVASTTSILLNGAAAASSGVSLNAANVWTAQQSASVTTLPISTSTFTPDGSNNHYKITLVHASCPCTLANPSATPVAGTDGTIEVIQSATGSDTIGTWGSQYIAPGGTASITLSTGANAIDLLSYHVIDSTHIAIVPALNFSH